MDRLGAHERILKAAEDRLDRDPVPLPSVQPPHSLGLELTHVPTVHAGHTHGRPLERVVQIHHGCVIYRDDAAEVRKSAARGPTLSENHTRTARPFWHTVEEVPTPGHAPHGGENMTRYSDFSKDAATALETLMRAPRSDGSEISQDILNLSETAASNPQSVAVGSCSRDSMLGSKLGYSPAT